ncbi:hypothetical protein ACBR19_14540 [Raoultella planticola]|uniref:hypothetical protein n=1 Tax=Raoultella planticola TaxID=575 RepID=UPI0035249249
MTTDITKLAQREKFEAWFVNDVVGADVTFPAFEDGAYAEGEIYDEQIYFMLQAMWMAWKAAGAELVEALEKAQRHANLTEAERQAYLGLISKRDERIAELESRTVTVKLPEPFKLAKSSSGLTYYYADEVNEALTEQGIKWEAE